MTVEQRHLLVGLYINSALYLAGCMALGYLTNHPIAWIAAVASAGFSYLCYLVQLVFDKGTGLYSYLGNLTFVCSLITGVGAGFALLG